MNFHVQGKFETERFVFQLGGYKDVCYYFKKIKFKTLL